MIDRRELLQRAAAMLGGAVSASAAAGVLAGCVATPPVEGDTPDYSWFTPTEAATMTALAARIIPATDTLGAVEVGAVPYIDNMLANYHEPRERQILREGLARIDRESQAAHQRPFAALTEDQQVQLMTGWDEEAYAQSQSDIGKSDPPRHFFRMTKELTTLAFFTSEYGATEFLQYKAVPGEWRADVPYSEIGRAWAT